MLFGKKDSLVGLDIGSRSVKVAEIVDSKGGPKLKRFGMADMPMGAIEDGAIHVKLDRRAHNPILAQAHLDKEPFEIAWLGGRTLHFTYQ